MTIKGVQMGAVRCVFSLIQIRLLTEGLQTIIFCGVKKMFRH